MPTSDHRGMSQQNLRNDFIDGPALRNSAPYFHHTDEPGEASAAPKERSRAELRLRVLFLPRPHGSSARAAALQ